MRKEMYLIRGTEKEGYPEFTARILDLAGTTAMQARPDALKVTLTQQAPPALSVIPFKKSKLAVISVYRESNAPLENLHGSAGFSGAFKVEEAIPVRNEKNWPDGEPSPGACLLTLFHRKPGIDYDKFIDRWHNSHTPLSLKIHPLTYYNRNVVLQKLCDGPYWYDGIVEEHTRTRKDLLNPFRFFGNIFEIIPHMISVYIDTNAFLDYKRIETYLAKEYYIVS